MGEHERIAAVILAAGQSARFGAPKQLARLGRRTVLERVVDVAHAACLDPVLVVHGPALPAPEGATIVINERPADGLSRSLRIGLAAVPPDVDRAVILLGDQPTLTVASIDRLVQANAATVVATRAGGRVGPPVLLRRTAFSLADHSSGDRGLASVLDRQGTDVSFVEASAHAPDVDEPSDLAALGEPCPGCDAVLPPVPEGPTHEYIGASPACWAAFGEVIAREFERASYGWIHRHTVDAYTAQHPGVDGRRQRQSVALHLVALCHWLEHGLDAAALTPITQRLASSGIDWPWLDPPAAYRMTVLDVLDATGAEMHGRLVRRWAECVWDAWSAHHSVIRRWASDALSEAS